MKKLLVHFLKELGEGRIEIAGRCCDDPIAVNDELYLEDRSSTRLQVISIDVYGKQVDLLDHGYVGNLLVQKMDDLGKPILTLLG